MTSFLSEDCYHENESGIMESQIFVAPREAAFRLEKVGARWSLRMGSLIVVFTGSYGEVRERLMDMIQRADPPLSTEPPSSVGVWDIS